MNLFLAVGFRDDNILNVIAFDEGGYEAGTLGHSIFAQGKPWNDLKELARDAVPCHFGVGIGPKMIKPQRISDEEPAAEPAWGEDDRVRPVWLAKRECAEGISSPCNPNVLAGLRKAIGSPCRESSLPVRFDGDGPRFHPWVW